MVVDFGVKNFSYFVLKFTINSDRGRRRFGPVRNRTLGMRLELGDVEDWMYASEVLQKA